MLSLTPSARPPLSAYIAVISRLSMPVNLKSQVLAHLNWQRRKALLLLSFVTISATVGYSAYRQLARASAILTEAYSIATWLILEYGETRREHRDGPGRAAQMA